jgi:hypothetical protein
MQCSELQGACALWLKHDNVSSRGNPLCALSHVLQDTRSRCQLTRLRHTWTERFEVEDRSHALPDSGSQHVL